MKISGSVFCDLCLKRCTFTKKKFLLKPREFVLTNYNEMTVYRTDGTQKKEYYCFDCMILMRGTAAKIILDEMDRKKNNQA